MAEFRYGFETTLRGAELDDAVRRVTEALASEGFGVLSTIDMRETLGERLGVDFREYLILGACHPTLAKQAIDHDPRIGLLLPYNVVIQRTQPGDLEVAIADPKTMFTMVEAKGLESVAAEAQRRLQRVIDVLEAQERGRQSRQTG